MKVQQNAEDLDSVSDLKDRGYIVTETRIAVCLDPMIAELMLTAPSILTRVGSLHLEMLLIVLAPNL